MTTKWMKQKNKCSNSFKLKEKKMVRFFLNSCTHKNMYAKSQLSTFFCFARICTIYTYDNTYNRATHIKHLGYKSDIYLQTQPKTKEKNIFKKNKKTKKKNGCNK